ncbi:MAG: CopM family metallochaperone [Pseudomonadota bacterium]
MTSIKLAIPLALSLAFGAGTSVLAQDMGYEKEMMSAHKKMMEDMMAMKPTGNPDKDFVMMMVPHHQGAIDMAEVQLKYGKDPELKKMAQDIIDAQKKEIEQFQKWKAANP